jgi:hypothetical protein
MEGLAPRSKNGTYETNALARHLNGMNLMGETQFVVENDSGDYFHICSSLSEAIAVFAIAPRERFFGRLTPEKFSMIEAQLRGKRKADEAKGNGTC